jgi:hypothetical protein
LNKSLSLLIKLFCFHFNLEFQIKNMLIIFLEDVFLNSNNIVATKTKYILVKHKTNTLYIYVHKYKHYTLLFSISFFNSPKINIVFKQEF